MNMPFHRLIPVPDRCAHTQKQSIYLSIAVQDAALKDLTPRTFKLLMQCRLELSGIPVRFVCLLYSRT